MDPNATLAQIRKLLAEIEEENKEYWSDPANDADPDACASHYDTVSDLRGDIADCVEALDGWLTKGGFLPDDWKGAR